MFKGGVMKTIKIVNIFFGGVVLAGLAACGGGGGGVAGGGTPPSVNSGGVSPEPTVMQGIYSGKIGDDDFVSLVVPATDLAKVKWYGLTFRPLQTDIYSGELTLGSDGVATASNLIAYLGNVAISLNGGITGASLDAYSGSMTIPPSVTPVVFTSAANKPPIFDAVQSAVLADLDGDWSGDWIDGLDSSRRLLIRFSPSAGKRILSSPSGFLGCTLSSESSATPTSSGNFFAVTLRFDQQIGQACARVGQTLSGFAAVYKPTPSTSRLEVIALEPSGRGISFRGDR
jgi:hypothetical protein